MSRQGLLVVISSPSGGGKTTIIRRLLKEGNPRYRYSVSATTRPKRPQEIDGVDYWFVSGQAFAQMIENGELVEYEEVHGKLYGTPRKPIEEWLEQGCIIFFDIDVKGAFSIQRHFPEQTCMIFVLPPDLATLKRRLTGRGTESSTDMQTRLDRVPLEIEMGQNFEFRVVNIDLEKTTQSVRKIIQNRLAQSERN